MSARYGPEADTLVRSELSRRRSARIPLTKVDYSTAKRLIFPTRTLPRVANATFRECFDGVIPVVTRPSGVEKPSR